LHIYQDVANIRNYFFKHLSGAKPLLSSIYKVGLENFGGMREKKIEPPRNAQILLQIAAIR
ncbi:MAG: hypothetical protein LHW56_00440, partial [Candidatus Cloacimonetes bacterium]|nr:hypothetical protein [Candidatus Cloacimonadota bacterium]MDY0171353.1 hypothetical protein [Candidatus Cloacimonadaceae bacterium]